MKIAIPKELRDGETRVAMSPDMIKKLVAMGLEVMIETGAGNRAMLLDDLYRKAGALIGANANETYSGADIVLKVRPPIRPDQGPDELAMIKSGALLIGLLEPLQNTDSVAAYAKAGVTAFAMELLPRISRAQSMDVLSSQSNLAGYKAVIEAAAAFGKAFPMMMTAAGTIAPAKVLVLGTGVAGLQAIATARRLGAIVSAFDVRLAAKEEAESLGAKFIEVISEKTQGAETKDGYAKEMSEEYKRKQKELIHETLKSQDIVITTALIPGKSAPVLITEEMVKDMNLGSVIVDLAIESGGNCSITELGKVVFRHGVTLIGHANMPGHAPVDASALYARSLVNFITPMIDPETKDLAIDWEDEIIAGTLITHDGKIVHPTLTNGEGR
ncbi:MAG TPA: Re/Si-specific NAD(P)(+) transhydrogenase subunit alpha [Alphaproteobacteria bacterium]|nr:Re/Si-specific NAD(P)(+) transhydrogenase subunit alpha [Alphaproteobacteria bacterium]HIO00498.1 Re/Si-specific NAD(P)(+) transhydrogenase subunit alpha [Alphaproteobacteria bacterium]